MDDFCYVSRSAEEAGLGDRGAFIKDFYQEHPSVFSRTDDEVAEFREAKQIHVEGEGVPRPITCFDESSFPGLLCRSTTHIKAVVAHTLVCHPDPKILTLYRALNDRFVAICGD